MNKTKHSPWIIFVFLAVTVLFVIPVLAAVLAIRFPIADLFSSKEPYETYEGTEYSYFYVDDEEQAQKDFEDIAYYFHNQDIREEFYAVIKTAANPGEAAQVLKEELEIDLSDFIPGIKKMYKTQGE